MRQVRRLGVGAVLALLTGLVTAGQAFAPPPACDLTQLQLRDSTVNQGLGSYDRLVRGKETLVKMYFSLPSCHDNNDSIQVTGGTLSATGGGSTLASGIAGTPSPVSTYPSAATYSAAPVVDAPADVKFVVPGANMAPVSTTDSFSASFTATINFQYKTSGTAAPVVAQRAFNTFATKTVEKRTNALRILVVPMGNTANSYATEFPASAVAAVENGMQTLSRLFPVPSGVSTLGSETGGVRYAIDSTLLNVTTPFCGTGANFDAIKAELAQFLVSWNATNPTAQADRVVGAVSSTVSNGSASGCADGMASLISPEAWVRAIPDAVGAPSMTGALFAMEIGHTFGLTPAARSFSTFHSLNSAADGTSPNRGYNVATRSYLSDDRTAMKLSGTWNNNTTLLEKEDYAFLACVLGGTVNAECTASGVAGTAGGVAALPQAFAVTGTTDNTNAGTHVEESFKDGNILPAGLDAGSGYRLVQRNGDTVLQNDEIRVSFGESHHDDATPEHTAAIGTFAAVVSLQEAATKFQLWKGAVGSGLLLWEANKTNEPTGVTVTGRGSGISVTKFTDTNPANESQPSLTNDGQWAAWVDEGDIKIGRTDKTGNVVTIDRPGAPAAVERIVFASDRDGDYEIYAMDFGGLNVQQLTRNTVVDRDPVLSEDGATIAFIRNGDIWLMDSDGSNERVLATTSATEFDVAFSHAGDRVAFVRKDGADDEEIVVSNIDGTGAVALSNNATGDQKPDWAPGDGTVAWGTLATASGQWGLVSAPSSGAGSPTPIPGSIDGALAPAYSPDGSAIAFSCACNNGTSIFSDVMVLNLDTGARHQFFYTPARHERHPSWSADGSRIVYWAGDDPVDNTSTIEYIDASDRSGDAPRTFLTNNEADDVDPDAGMLLGPAPALSGPAWGPPAIEGSSVSLAFVSLGDGSIYTLGVNLGGTTAVPDANAQLVYDASDANPARRPTWNPNGTELAFERFLGDNETDIAILILASGTVFQTVDNARQPSWSRSTTTDRLAYVMTTETGTNQIRSFAPGVEFSDRFEANGTQPAWDNDVGMTYTSGNDIWFRDTAKNTDQLVVQSGFDSDIAGTSLMFVRSFATGIEDSQTDLMLAGPGGSDGDVTVQATDDNIEDNKLDVLVDCGDGLTHIAAVALEPTSVAGSTATWETNYDPSLTCASPTLTVAVSDGYNRVISSDSEEIVVEEKPPTAAIYTPYLGQVFDQYDLVPARGSGWDAEDGTLTNLQWQLTGPSYSASGSGDIADFAPPTGGFPVGAYELKLTVTDSTNKTDTATRTFSIVADTDNDGLTDEEEGVGCLVVYNTEYASADLDPMNAYLDNDTDGIVNVDDEAPCEAATNYEASITFDPNEIQFGSTGVFTARVSVPNRDMRDVATVWIESINGIAATGLNAQQWIVPKGTNVGQAKFDRSPLNAFMVEHGLLAGSTLRIVVAGASTGDAWKFEGVGLLVVK